MSTLDNIIPSVVGSSLGVLTSPLTSQIASDNQKDLMDYQNKLQEANWDKHFREQNAQQQRLLINSPAMQVQGYKNAGLNPALLSGRFGDVSSIPSTPSQGVSIPSPSVNISDMIRVGEQATQLYNESKVADAQARLLNANAKLAETDALTRGELNQVTIDNLVKGGVLTDAQAHEVNAHRDFLNTNAGYLLDMADTARHNSEILATATNQNNQYLKKLTDKVDAETLWLPRLASADIYNKVAQGQLAYAEGKRAIVEANKLQYELDNLSPLQVEQVRTAIAGAKIENGKMVYDLNKLKTFDPETRAYLEMYGPITMKLIGIGAGAVAGAIAGSAGGPVGTGAGAVAGAVVGAVGTK